MNRNPLSSSISTILFAPEGDISSPAPAIAAADSPTGSQIDLTPRSDPPPPEIIGDDPTAPKPAKQIRQKGVEMSARDFLGLGKEDESALDKEARLIRERNEKGQFTKARTELQPLKKKEPATKPVVAPKPVVKVDTAPPVQKPATEAPKPVVAPSKIKIGDQEKTTEEWQAHFKTLEDKANKPPEPKVEAPKVDEVAKTPEQEEAELNQRREAYMQKALPHYTLTATELDGILLGGQPAVEAFAKILSKVELRSREAAAHFVNQATEQFGRELDGLNPFVERSRQAQQYQTEHSFLSQHADIKAHGEGLKTMREASQELHEEHDQIAELLSINPNRPNASKLRERQESLEKDFLTELAKATRARLNLNGQPPKVEPPAPTPPPKKEEPKPRPPSPSMQLGGSNAPKAKSGNDGGFHDMPASFGLRG